MVYVGTVYRALPETLAATDLIDITQLTREQIANAVRQAFDDPVAAPGRAGRPRQTQEGVVQKIVVLRELHASGEPQFHVVVKLRSRIFWYVAKRTLREREKIPSHWSASHAHWWSAVRYGVVPSEKKPDVDPEPFQWSADGQHMDLFAESQEPYTARAWNRRRENHEEAAAATKKRKGPSLQPSGSSI